MRTHKPTFWSKQEVSSAVKSFQGTGCTQVTHMVTPNLALLPLPTPRPHLILSSVVLFQPRFPAKDSFPSLLAASLRLGCLDAPMDTDWGAGWGEIA